MKASALLVCVVLLTGCASQATEEEAQRAERARQDAVIGFEAQSIGNWSLAKVFLEAALGRGESGENGAHAKHDESLSPEMRMQAAQSLAHVLYELNEREALREHLHHYWPIPAPGTRAAKRDDNQALRYHLKWSCRFMDDDADYADAQACWNSIYEIEKARASIRAMAIKEVLVRPTKTH